VHAAQEFMEGHLDGRVTTDDVARHVAVSPRTLSRRFHSATGRTPNEFLTEARLSAARRLLETTQMTVIEIRQAVGYHDAAAFGRAFKRAVGLSPTDYRRRYGPTRKYPISGRSR
jgi:transcriptional regulator GlxA family with amidase domain